MCMTLPNPSTALKGLEEQSIGVLQAVLNWNEYISVLYSDRGYLDLFR